MNPLQFTLWRIQLTLKNNKSHFAPIPRREWAPWLIGALVWGGVTTGLLREAPATMLLEDLHGLWIAFSMLWGMFGFAGLFQVFYRQRWTRLGFSLGVALAPPVVVFLAIFGLPF